MVAAVAGSTEWISPEAVARRVSLAFQGLPLGSVRGERGEIQLRLSADYAEAGVRNIGYESNTSPYNVHAFMLYAISWIPTALFNRVARRVAPVATRVCRQQNPNAPRAVARFQNMPRAKATTSPGVKCPA